MTILENILWGAVGGVIGSIITNLILKPKPNQDIKELLKRKEPGQ
jgi:hypothetical protein